MKHRALMIPICLLLFVLLAAPFSSSARQTIGSIPWSGVIYDGTGLQKKAPRELGPTATRRVAERHGLSVDELEITNSSVAHYRHSNKEAYLFELEDKAGNDYYVWLDKSGKEVDEAQLVKENNDARHAKYGKLSEPLSDYLAKASFEEEIPVFVLVEMPPDSDKPKQKQTSMSSERLKNMSDEEKRQLEKDDEDYEKLVQDYHLGRAKMFVEPIAERLKKVGSDVQTFGTSAQIYVKLKPKMIREVERWREIRAIDRVGTGRPELDISFGIALAQSNG